MPKTKSPHDELEDAVVRLLSSGGVCGVEGEGTFITSMAIADEFHLLLEDVHADIEAQLDRHRDDADFPAYSELAHESVFPDGRECWLLERDFFKELTEGWDASIRRGCLFALNLAIMGQHGGLPEDYAEMVDMVVEGKKAQAFAEGMRQGLVESLKDILPLYRYCRAVLNSPSVYSTDQIAQDYGMTEEAFSLTLCWEGLLFKKRGQWMVSADYRDKGYVQSVTEPLPDGTSFVYTGWTEKGRLFLFSFLAERGIHPAHARSEQEAERERGDRWRERTLRGSALLDDPDEDSCGDDDADEDW